MRTIRFIKKFKDGITKPGRLAGITKYAGEKLQQEILSTENESTAVFVPLEKKLQRKFANGLCVYFRQKGVVLSYRSNEEGVYFWVARKEEIEKKTVLIDQSFKVERDSEILDWIQKGLKGKDYGEQLELPLKYDAT